VRLQFDDRRTRLVLLYLLNSNPGVFRRSTSAVRAMSMALSVKAGRSASCSAQAQICDLIHIYTASLWTVSLCRTTARPSFTNWRISTGVEVTAPLSVTEMGFSLHAATTASAEDSRGREALVRYALRPPIAQERLHILPDNLVRIELRRPFRDGDAEEWLKNQTLAIDLDPLSLLCRLAASVPPPGFHLVHYAGVLASKVSKVCNEPIGGRGNNVMPRTILTNTDARTRASTGRSGVTSSVFTTRVHNTISIRSVAAGVCSLRAIGRVAVGGTTCQPEHGQ